MLFRDLFKKEGALLDLANLYAEGVWAAWKAGMKVKFDNPDHPFKGAPSVGIEIEMLDGSKKVLKGTDRIRINQVSDFTLEQVFALYAAQAMRKAGREKEDLFHPQYVETFDELLALSADFVNDNRVPVVNALVWLADNLPEEATTEDAANFIDEVLSGAIPEKATFLNQIVRAGWLARALVQGQAPGNRDFKPAVLLDSDIAKIDEYVVKPVFESFAKDMREGKFES